jgi:uncharacterized metal-binding protein YceD (DUF177 family)
MSGINEFERPYRLDTLGSARRAHIAAEEAERTALARRFGLLAIHRLEAEAELWREDEIVWAEGEARAEYDEQCIATGETLSQSRAIPFRLRFVSEEAEAAATAEEIELSDEDCDTLTHDGAAIDLGEAVAQTFALGLDPFPRGPNADAALRAAGVIGEDEAGPFAALKALRDKLL